MSKNEIKSRSVFLDTNLLLLMIVGNTSVDYIKRHKRVSSFSVSEFNLLLDFLSDFEAILITPNILSETSNLAAQIREPARSEISSCLRDLILNSEESYIPSTTASSRTEFPRLGLVDASILEVGETGTTLITTDLDLYIAASKAGIEAVNFNHIREQYL